MKRTISAMEARRKLGELLEGVFYRGDEVIIERGGKPMAAVLPIERLHAIDAARREARELLGQIQQHADPMTEQEAMKLADEVVKDVRRKRRAEKAKRSA